MTGTLRWMLVGLHGFVSVTAFAGGGALLLSALDPDFESSWEPPSVFLEGSPFSSYLVPGIVLIVFLGLLQAVACVAQFRRLRSAPLISALAGLVVFGWIFVQMIYIPFSALQVVYFVVAMAQVVTVLAGSDVLTRAKPWRWSTTVSSAPRAARRRHP